MVMIFIIGGMLAIFTVASILNQIKQFKQKLVRFDPLSVLPNYSFFAPKPIANDYRLAYKIVAGNDSDWLELPMYKKFSWLRVLWNPFKYYNKGMIDTSHFLLMEFNELENKKFIQVSLHYLSILMVISDHLKSKRAKDLTVRFAIIASGGVDSVKIERVMFASYNQKI